MSPGVMSSGVSAAMATAQSQVHQHTNISSQVEKQLRRLPSQGTVAETVNMALGATFSPTLLMPVTLI